MVRSIQRRRIHKPLRGHGNGQHERWRQAAAMDLRKSRLQYRTDHDHLAIVDPGQRR